MKSTARFRTLSVGYAGVIVCCMLMSLIGVLLWVPAATAQGSFICIPIHADILSTFVADGCESPVGLCTKGQITQGGILNGTTEFTALAVAPAAGMFGVEPDTTLSYSGMLTVTAKLGTLTFWDVGVLDQMRGVFSELDRVMEGTERFFGSKGTLYIYGTVTPDGTGFRGPIRGEVCLAN